MVAAELTGSGARAILVGLGHVGLGLGLGLGFRFGFGFGFGLGLGLGLRGSRLLVVAELGHVLVGDVVVLVERRLRPLLLLHRLAHLRWG